MLIKSDNKEIKKSLDNNEEKELRILSMIICTMVEDENYIEGEEKVREAMCLYPHSPIPHNLMGILLVKQKNHLLALKHFRAAYALDPTYLPARNNLDQYTDSTTINNLYHADPF